MAHGQIGAFLPSLLKTTYYNLQWRLVLGPSTSNEAKGSFWYSVRLFLPHKLGTKKTYQTNFEPRLFH